MFLHSIKYDNMQILKLQVINLSEMMKSQNNFGRMNIKLQSHCFHISIRICMTEITRLYAGAVCLLLANTVDKIHKILVFFKHTYSICVAHT